jgi:hypothetical protein
MNDFSEIDEDEVDDSREPDDEDDDDPEPPQPRVKPLRLQLEREGRTVETYLICDSHSVRVDASERYESFEAAQRAYERIKQELLDEGYKEA